MKHFLKKHGLWILFAAAVIAVALSVMSVFTNTSAPLTNLAGVITSPFRSAFTAVAEWFNDKQAYYADYKALEAENAELRNRIAEMEEAVRQSEADSEENARFRSLLNLREQRKEFDFESAHITARNTSNWTSSLTLNRGTDHGVAVGDCVVNEQHYLVGVVSEVGLNWCTVLTTIDTDTQLGAMVFRTDEIGVASGDFNLMGEKRLKLSYLPADSTLLNGDLVVTSGVGGYYPTGLVIGSVEEVKLDDSGLTQYAVIAPMVDFDELSQVFIIKDFDIVE
ncbi:rod shape-determining protein MreC [Oscillibacter hominis]|uniref:Cell shape-determining protein MreC n=1 Tax=Oscillibacter hominis TaxID=2763056 RepID=A0A7G9B3S7_9FIRM|nr:rod shape-determining protein MreC [Oscillibacter hominis]QNL44208.1 rod shape-determining protein MreC [Oscillibacter hominis]